MPTIKEMNTSANKITYSTTAVSVRVEGKYIVVTLEDGRIMSVPVYYFDELEHAPKKKRENVEIFYGGKGLRWPLLDIHLNVPRLLGVDED